jgi:hypothetical protein
MAGENSPKGRLGKRNKPQIGPFSRDRSIVTVDLRYRAGRILKQVRDDLTQQLGGAPTAAEALMIQAASVKAVRLYMMSDVLLERGDIHSDEKALSWANSMRMDLMALGLKARPRVVETSPLRDYFEKPLPLEPDDGNA